MNESNVRKFPGSSRVEPGKIPDPQLHIQQPTTKNKNWKQLTSTEQSTIQKCHQEKFTLIKLEDLPLNQAVGKKTWW